MDWMAMSDGGMCEEWEKAMKQCPAMVYLVCFSNDGDEGEARWGRPEGDRIRGKTFQGSK